MPEKPVRILIVGLESPHLHALLDRLAREGWASYSVESHREARTVFDTLRFDIVLASEYLADGSGYDLSPEVSRRFATLFVELAVSEGQLWVPVVRHGTRTLGDPALDAPTFESELRTQLSNRTRPRRIAVAAAAPAAASAPKAESAAS